MDGDFRVLEALHQPPFKTYFLYLLDSSLPVEEKYQKILDYFRCPEEQRVELLSALSGVDPDCGEKEFVVEQLPSFSQTDYAHLVQVAGAIQRAVKRLARSQHQDGGWGVKVEESTIWHTAYALLCLGAARRCGELLADFSVTPLIRRGFAYLEQQADQWAADAIEAEGVLSIYDLALVVRCFFQGGREFMRRETAVRVYRSIDHLYHAQNMDGGWDASLWGYAVATPTRVFSEVGATTAALQTLGYVSDERFLPAIKKAVRWLLDTQNLEGSWNNGSARPDLPPYTLTGDPRENKTCDAIQGILAAAAFDLPIQPYKMSIARAVDWLMRREQPVLDKHRRVAGWGWGFTAADYENTCLALETLLKLPNLPLPLLTANVTWLIDSQHKDEGDSEDGSWVLGHTARITCGLIEYYRKLQGPSLDHQWLP